MYKTIENEVTKQATPKALQYEFYQYDVERLHNFSGLIYIGGIGIWVLFDLIIGFIGDQRHYALSLLLVVLLLITVGVQRVARKARHFHLLNLVYVLMIGLGIRVGIEGVPAHLHPTWLSLSASNILYSASVLPLSREAFFGVLGIAWVVLNPFMMTTLSLFDFSGTMVLLSAVFISALTIYTYLKLRRSKLHNYIMAKLLIERAYIDTLTEIPNRRAFMTRASNHLSTPPESGECYLAMVDVDNFKKVNDVYGHDIGDEVLKRIAADIKHIMADHEYARLGGEEFGVYLSGVTQADAERLVDTLCQRVRETSSRYPATVSVGVTRIETDTLHAALIKADHAMYESKLSGKDRYTFFRPD